MIYLILFLLASNCVNYMMILHHISGLSYSNLTLDKRLYRFCAGSNASFDERLLSYLSFHSCCIPICSHNWHVWGQQSRPPCSYKGDLQRLLSYTFAEMIFQVLENIDRFLKRKNFDNNIKELYK